MIVEALDHLVRGIVDNPDDVAVSTRRQRGHSRFSGRQTYEVRVNPDDLGRVIGRSGRTATALRTVLRALGDDPDVRIDFVDVDRRR